MLCASAVPAAAISPAAEKDPGLGGEVASDDARKLANWVIGTRDHGDMPFLLVDKVEAKVFAFDSRGRLLGVSPALLGLGKGDVSPEGNRRTQAVRHHPRRARDPRRPLRRVAGPEPRR
jgi:hypothetical protein